MKKFILCSAIISAFFTGCSKVKSLADINVDIPYEQQVQVPAVAGYSDIFPLPPGGVSLPFPAVAVATGSKGYLDQYHTSSSKVVSVSLKGLNLVIQAPQGETFDFLDSVQLFISAPAMPEILVAYDYNIPRGQTSLSIPVTNNDLKNYFLQDTMYFREQMHINALPAAGTGLDIKSVFHLVANPLY